MFGQTCEDQCVDIIHFVCKYHGCCLCYRHHHQDSRFVVFSRSIDATIIASPCICAVQFGLVYINDTGECLSAWPFRIATSSARPRTPPLLLPFVAALVTSMASVCKLAVGLLLALGAVEAGAPPDASTTGASSASLRGANAAAAAASAVALAEAPAFLASAEGEGDVDIPPADGSLPDESSSDPLPSDEDGGRTWDHLGGSGVRLRVRKRREGGRESRTLVKLSLTFVSARVMKSVDVNRYKQHPKLVLTCECASIKHAFTQLLLTALCSRSPCCLCINYARVKVGKKQDRILHQASLLWWRDLLLGSVFACDLTWISATYYASAEASAEEIEIG